MAPPAKAKARRATAVHYGRNAVTVLTAEHTSAGMTIRALSRKEVAEPNGSGSALAAVVREALEDVRRKGGLGPVVASLPARHAVIREATVPKVADEPFVAAIQTAARRHIPFDLRDSNFDFQVLSDSPEAREASVLFVAAPRRTVASVTEPLVAAGAEPWIVDMEPLAAVNALLALDPLANDEALGLLEVSATASTLTLVSREGHFLTRGVGAAFGGAQGPRPSEEDDPTAEAIAEPTNPHTPGVVVPIAAVQAERGDQLLLDIRRTLAFFFQSIGGRPALRLHVVGTAALRDHVIQRIRESLALDASAPSPVEKLQLASGVLIPDALQDGATMDLLVALGLALRAPDEGDSGTFRINVYPDRSRRKRDERQRAFSAAGMSVVLGINVLALAFLLATAHTVAGYNRDNEMALANVNSHIAALHSTGANETSREALVRERAERRVWAPALAGIAHAVPQRLTLTAVTLDAAPTSDTLNSTVVIRGKVAPGADYVAPVADYVGRLRATPAVVTAFPYVQLSSTWEARGDNGVTHFFEVRCSARGDRR